MKLITLFAAILVALALSACEARTDVVAVPTPAPRTVVVPAQGPPGPQGAPGEPGKSNTVVVVPPASNNK